MTIIQKHVSIAVRRTPLSIRCKPHCCGDTNQPVTMQQSFFLFTGKNRLCKPLPLDLAKCYAIHRIETSRPAFIRFRAVQFVFDTRHSKAGTSSNNYCHYRCINPAVRGYSPLTANRLTSSFPAITASFSPCSKSPLREKEQAAMPQLYVLQEGGLAIVPLHCHIHEILASSASNHYKMGNLTPRVKTRRQTSKKRLCRYKNAGACTQFFTSGGTTSNHEDFISEWVGSKLMFSDGRKPRCGSRLALSSLALTLLPELAPPTDYEQETR